MYQIFTLFILSSLVQTYQSKEERLIIEELFTSPNLIENKKFSITCQVNKGPVDFDWHHNGKMIVSNDDKIIINNHHDNSMLNIKQMSLDYAGDYTCKVKNSFNEQDSQTISVKLNVKPRWIVEPTDVVAKLNSILDVKCEVNAIPSPKIKWIKLSSNGEEEMTIDDNELKFNFTRQNASLYKCLAENRLGRIEKVIRINYYGIH